jgi:hypothetical protein
MSEHFEDSNQLLVSGFSNTYCWPPGFGVDERYSDDDPFVSDESLDTFNAKQLTI